MNQSEAPIVIDGSSLSLADVAAVARGAKVALSNDRSVLDRVARSRQVITRAVESGEQIYGVTTLFGGMADQYVPPEKLVDVQNVALWSHQTTTGPRLPNADVRAAMLLRANSLMKGVSGIRLELIQRYVSFLNAGATPHVYQRGSIGASGDLVPLAYIAGAVIGLNANYKVDLKGETLDCQTALKRLGLDPVALQPKEGLALNNGTGASTGVAALCAAKALDGLAHSLAIQALYFQALLATDQSFDPFIQQVKPHPGQIWTADQMRQLLAGSKLMRSEAAGDRSHRAGKLIQDRYSLRCMPQYTGPIVDGLALAARQVEVEANSANDNPLIDPDSGQVYHTGNFLAQYTGVAMDAVRYHVSQLAKHLDVQIALLVTPEFNYGLPPSLTGNMDAGVNVGFKSLQITCNSMAPLIGYYAQSIADQYPTHAEQYNQNINSQAMNSANLARDSLDVFDQFLAASVLFGVQALELRAKAVTGGWDPRSLLSEPTARFYEAARKAAGHKVPADGPLLFNDLEGIIQPMLEGCLEGVRSGLLLEAVPELARNARALGRGSGG